MAFDNTITVVGNGTRDPELRFTQGGMAVANFGVAWNKKKADGEEEVSFFNVSCFRQLAENVAESITKGSRVVVYGMLYHYADFDSPSETRTAARPLAKASDEAATISSAASANGVAILKSYKSPAASGPTTRAREAVAWKVPITAPR